MEDFRIKSYATEEEAVAAASKALDATEHDTIHIVFEYTDESYWLVPEEELDEDKYYTDDSTAELVDFVTKTPPKGWFPKMNAANFGNPNMN